jgi:steroid delta-isomerase-like uncharacterized protein
VRHENPQALGLAGATGDRSFAAMSEQHNKQIVDEFIQALFTRGELDAVDRYLSPDFVNHNPTWPGQPGDRESMRAASEVMRAACPDWHSDLEELIAEGDMVVERFTASGTHESELMGIAPTGQTVTLPGINIFRLKDGRIVERWGVLDMLGFMRQLGAIPAAV